MAASSGCLVLSDPEFRGQDECAPSFLAHEADPPINARTRISPEPPDGLAFKASVPLRTCALTRNYEGRVFVDGNPAFQPVAVPVSGSELRTVALAISTLPYPPGCHQVELRVSSRFADNRTPERPGDLAMIVWWFSNDPSGNARFTDCGQPQ